MNKNRKEAKAHKSELLNYVNWLGNSGRLTVEEYQYLLKLIQNKENS